MEVQLSVQPEVHQLEVQQGVVKNLIKPTRVLCRTCNCGLV